MTAVIVVLLMVHLATPVEHPPRAHGYDPAMAKVQYESKENAGRKFWTAHYGRHAIRIDANRPGVYPRLITLEGHTVYKGVAPGRDEADAAVSDALDELTR
jgi:hypothetical protein